MTLPGRQQFEQFIRDNRPDLQLHTRFGGHYIDYTTEELSEAWAAGWEAARTEASKLEIRPQG